MRIPPSNKSMNPPTGEDRRILEIRAAINAARASIELAKQKQTNRRLEITATGGDPSTDQTLQWQAAFIEQREAEIAGSEAEIARLEARKKLRDEQVPGLIVQRKAIASELITLLQQAEIIYRDLDDNRSAILRFADEHDRVPGVATNLIGLGVYLDPFCGFEVQGEKVTAVGRFIRDAREAGIE
jgi:hypothetical protein